jgi:plasmid stabilization system protein ParE
MTFGVLVRPRARNDVRAARDWYEKQRAGLGDQLGSELDAAILRIAERPLLYPKIHNDVRRALTRRFPYAIYFVIATDHVTVLRVLHQARDPEESQR